MKRVVIILWMFCLCWTDAFCAKQVNISDIHRVTQKMFSFHIENKSFTPALVRRCIKIYIEQFDPEKCYLLESEVLPFLKLSDRQLQAVIRRLEQEDYSDFFLLNQLMQTAILRAQRIRAESVPHLVNQDFRGETSFTQVPSSYATTEEALAERQLSKMRKFYVFHKQRSPLNSAARKEKLYALFEAKIQRWESQYLQDDSSSFSEAKRESFVALKILKAFAKSLDTHTAFFSPEEAYEMRRSLEKQFEGVGVILSEGIDGVVISELIKGSPAAESGAIQVNDLLVEIDGEDVSRLPFEEVVDRLKGKDKGKILLGFKRLDMLEKETTFFQVALEKKPIVMNEERIQVGYEKHGDGIIGKIVLYSFYETAEGMSSERDIKEAIHALNQIAPLHGLVLDLRENSGGFLSQAVKVAGLFVTNGVIVISKYSGGDVHYLRNVVNRSFYQGPLVVLTSKMSASASEIVAQALQDYGVGLVVGDERTFGKGSIQYQTVTDERAPYFFKVTVGRYYTASGRGTQIEGVQADIVVPSLYAPYNIGEKYLEFPLSADRVDAAFLDPLSDLDAKTRQLFQKKYMPHLQQVVTVWKKMLPILQKKSRDRLAQNPQFQELLKRQIIVRERQKYLPVNSIDEPISISLEDMQMEEAVNIVKDMIWLQERSSSESETTWELQPTGSD